MNLNIYKQVRKDSKKIPQADLKRIFAALTRLANDPYDPALDTKKLKASPLYRLRVGNYRVFYNIEGDHVNVFAIERRSSKSY